MADTRDLRSTLGPRTRFIIACLGMFFNVVFATVGGAMVQQGTIGFPKSVVWLLGAILGFGNTWAFIHAYFKEPPNA